MWRTDSFEQPLMLEKIEGGKRRGRQRMSWLDGITNSMAMSLCKLQDLWWTGKPGVLQSMGSQRVRHNWATELNWWEELIHWERPWCWERLKAGGEGDDREWDGWMASPAQWIRVWASSGSWWWTGMPGMLHSMGLQRDTTEWLNWTELNTSVDKDAHKGNDHNLDNLSEYPVYKVETKSWKLPRFSLSFLCA